MERSYVNATDLENELEKRNSLHTNILSYSVSWCLKWDGTYVCFYQSMVRKYSVKNRFALNLKTGV